MKIEISDIALSNDKQGVILSFIKFAENLFENTPVLTTENENGTEWIVSMDEQNFLTSLKFKKKKYTREKAIEIFNLIVYGKSASDSEIEDVPGEG
jgi:hypothetical protein